MKKITLLLLAVLCFAGASKADLWTVGFPKTDVSHSNYLVTRWFVTEKNSSNEKITTEVVTDRIFVEHPDGITKDDIGLLLRKETVHGKPVIEYNFFTGKIPYLYFQETKITSSREYIPKEHIIKYSEENEVGPVTLNSAFFTSNLIALALGTSFFLFMFFIRNRKIFSFSFILLGFILEIVYLKYNSAHLAVPSYFEFPIIISMVITGLILATLIKGKKIEPSSVT